MGGGGVFFITLARATGGGLGLEPSSLQPSLVKVAGPPVMPPCRHARWGGFFITLAQAIVAAVGFSPKPGTNTPPPPFCFGDGEGNVFSRRSSSALPRHRHPPPFGVCTCLAHPFRLRLRNGLAPLTVKTDETLADKVTAPAPGHAPHYSASVPPLVLLCRVGGYYGGSGAAWSVGGAGACTAEATARVGDTLPAPFINRSLSTASWPLQWTPTNSTQRAWSKRYHACIVCHTQG